MMYKITYDLVSIPKDHYLIPTHIIVPPTNYPTPE